MQVHKNHSTLFLGDIFIVHSFININKNERIYIYKIIIHSRDMFAGAYDKCYDQVSALLAWLLCWPMKLTFVCNIVQALGGRSVCDPVGKVDTGFGEGYVSLKGMTRDNAVNKCQNTLAYHST